MMSIFLTASESRLSRLSALAAMVVVLLGSGQGAGQAVATSTLSKPKGISPPAPTEDCVTFNPQTAAVSNVRGRWTIVDGRHLMFSFGPNRAEANLSLSFIKRYRMNRSCFVGRPDPSFEYLTVGAQAPQGEAPGEDCVAFNPANTAVRNINGSWGIVEGRHSMFNFGAKQDEAKLSLQIIKHYGFTNSCFVGRPDASFKYLRR